MKESTGVPMPLRVALEEALREPHDVVAAVAQRRQMDVDGVEPIQQVAAEAARLDLGFDVGVRGREHAHVDLLRARGAKPLELAALEHAQQARLLGRRDVRDLVEEQRAADRLARSARRGRPWRR